MKDELVYFEDNEAVIKMIIKGRNPNLTHVSRTHRDTLDWLFDRINLDPKLRISYVDYDNQLADISTKDVSHVMNRITFYAWLISDLTALKAALSSILKIALRVWRSDNKKVTTMNESSPNQSESEIWYRGAVRGHQRRHLPRYLQPRGISDQKITKWGLKLERRNPVPIINKKVSLSEIEWRTLKRGMRRSRATTGSPMTRKPSQTEDLTACMGYPVLTTFSWHAGSGLETKEECGILSARSISFIEKVYERLRIVLNCPPGEEMKGIDENSLVWRIFMASFMHAAIFLGKDYSENLHCNA